jgi:predicted membrane protein DUF2306
MERLVFGSAMVLSIALGVDAIRRRNFASHGEWMMRAYAIGLGAGTQVLTHLPWFVLVDGKPGELPRAVMMGAGWVINVIVAEWIIRRQQGRLTKPLMENSMSRSTLAYGVTLLLLTTAMPALAQDKPTLQVVWPTAHSVIAIGDDLEKSIGVVVSSNFKLLAAGQCGEDKRCGHVHMRIDPDGNTCNIPGRPYNSMNSDFGGDLIKARFGHCPSPIGIHVIGILLADDRHQPIVVDGKPVTAFVTVTTIGGLASAQGPSPTVRSP